MNIIICVYLLLIQRTFESHPPSLFLCIHIHILYRSMFLHLSGVHLQVNGCAEGQCYDGHCVQLWLQHLQSRQHLSESIFSPTFIACFFIIFLVKDYYFIHFYSHILFHCEFYLCSLMMTTFTCICMCLLVIPISLENFFSQLLSLSSVRLPLYLLSGCKCKQVFHRYMVCRCLLLLESYLHFLDSVLQKATWFVAAIVLVLIGRRPNDLFLLYRLHFQCWDKWIFRCKNMNLDMIPDTVPDV